MGPKVLHLISGGERGGSKKHLLTLLPALRERGVDVELVCFLDGPLYREAKEAGIPATLLLQRSRRDPRVIQALVRKVREEGVSLVHALGGRANYAALQVMGRLSAHANDSRSSAASSPPAFLSTVHSLPRLDYLHQPWWKRLLFTALNLRALRRFHHLIAVSQAFAAALEREGIPRRRISVVYNGIDPAGAARPYSREELERLTGWELQGEEPLLVMVSRLHPVKRIPDFLHALKDLGQRGIPCKALIAGDGPLRGELARLIASLGLAEQVRLLGFRQDVEALLASAHLSVLTSQSESFPYVLLESGKVGTPALATRVGGIPDLLPDELLFAAGDVAGLTEKLARLLTSPQDLKQWGEYLRQRVVNRYSLQRLAEDHLTIYRRVLDERKREREE